MALLAGSFVFNVPLTSFSNTGSGVGVTASLVTSLKAGVPAKNRGLHFDGLNPGHVMISGLVIAPQFSFHSWLFFSTSTPKRVLIHKPEFVMIY